jgi:glycosyltransferase involved in cell wall biosynthesis
MPHKVCYLSTGIMDTAFDSQVLPVLERLKESGYDLIHISFNPFNFKKTEGYFQKRDELGSTGIKTFFFRQTPPISRSFLIFDTERIRPFFTHWWGKKGKVVIHCRGHLNAYRGLLLKKLNSTLINVISDLRGAMSDEVYEESRGFLKDLFVQYLGKFYQDIENQVVRKGDRILCVSNAFKEFLGTNYHVKNITTIPTFVDTSRFKFSKSLRESYREKLGLSKQTVLVYSGGIAPWQKIGSVVSLFNHLRQKVNDLFMLFLTQEPDLVKRMIKDQIKLEDFLVVRVPHGEVAGYLCAADVGILLRENTLTNNVASPIKFSEYMCCGLPCIISPNIGDTAEIIRNGRAGIVLDSQMQFPTSSEFQRLLSLNRNEISDIMYYQFSSRIFIPKILSLYENFAEGERISLSCVGSVER